jgi:hypothetical protein
MHGHTFLTPEVIVLDDFYKSLEFPAEHTGVFLRQGVFLSQNNCSFPGFKAFCKIAMLLHSRFFLVCLQFFGIDYLMVF